VGVYPETKLANYFSSLGLPLEEQFMEALADHGYCGYNEDGLCVESLKDETKGPCTLQSFSSASLKTLATMTDMVRVDLINGASVGVDKVSSDGKTADPELIAGIAEYCVSARARERGERSEASGASTKMMPACGVSGSRPFEASTKTMPVCGMSGSQEGGRGEPPRTPPAAGEVAAHVLLGRTTCAARPHHMCCSAAPHVLGRTTCARDASTKKIPNCKISGSRPGYTPPHATPARPPARPPAYT
jgi:hypothetical protein